MPFDCPSSCSLLFYYFDLVHTVYKCYQQTTLESDKLTVRSVVTNQKISPFAENIPTYNVLPSSVSDINVPIKNFPRGWGIQGELDNKNVPTPWN